MLTTLVAVAGQVTAAQIGLASASDDPEIIVTGERIPRRARETASSLIVVNESEIENAGYDRVDNLLGAIPNVQLGTGSEGPAIRGQDTTGAIQALPGFLGGSRARTTLVVDGRAATYNEFIFGTAPLWDVARVEVFRSPQTTTQGQNSIAGAIFVDTNDPTFRPEYRARLISGTHRTGQFSALASGSVAGDTAAFRLAGDIRYRRVSSRIVDTIAGGNPNHDAYGLLRAKLLVTPPTMPATRLILTYAHNESLAPQIVGLSRPFHDRRDRAPNYGVFRNRIDSITAQLRQQISSALTVDATMSSGNRKIRRLARKHFGEATNNGVDWSGETVLRWDRDGPLRVIGGASYSHVGLSQFIDLSLLSGIVGRFRDVQDGFGLFVNAEMDIGSGTRIEAGLRSQNDRQKRNGGLATDFGAVPLNYDRKFDALLPKLSIAHDLRQGLTLGVLVQKAYNPGGTTLRFDTGQADILTAERLWDYEAFVRAGRSGGRFMGSANLFRYQIRGAQRFEPFTIKTPNGFPVGFANLFNVPRARAQGAEGEIRWQPNGAFSARASLGLLSTRVTRTDSESAKFQGKEFNRSPHLSAAAGVDWTTRELQLSAQVRHHSGYFSDGANDPRNRVHAGTIVDGRVQYGSGSLRLFAQVRNLFDAFSLTEITNAGLTATAEDPLEIMVGVDRRF